MALYEVSRTDQPAPGEFVSALVIAGGTALARSAVAHMSGVNGSNVEARRIDVNAARAGDNSASVLSSYFDETEPLPTDYDDAGIPV